MEKLTEIPANVRAVGITLALAALLIAVLTIANAANPINAQGANPDPKPCGPGQQDPSENPDATVSRGHYAIFDGYWDEDDKTLEPNLCPPSVVHMMETTTDPVTGFITQEEVSTRTASNINIRQTVIHIDDVFAHVLTEDDVETYDFFKTGVSTTTLDTTTNTYKDVDTAVGQTVWWLMAEEEGEEEDETEPEFHMGFSAALFDPADWYKDGDGDKGAKPLQYEFEVIREPGIPVDEQGHLYAFDEIMPPADSSAEIVKTADWDSSEVDANALALYPGDYYHYQWAFTRPGTYIVSVQLKGHVRTKDDPRPANAAADWKPISDKRVETSEVMQYVFQVGPLTLNDEPAFEVERSVEEHSANETPVGAPIPVYQGDDDNLTFELSGPGHSLFSVDANGQIKVAGDLDREVRSEYRLTLSVRDNKDHERNTDALVDNSISVRINVTDQPEAERSVAENSAGGALVGDPITVAGANAGTAYALDGNGSDLFTVENSDNNAQIEVADGAVLNYEDASSYILTLSADTAGAEDVRVTINVVDDPNERLAITLAVDPSSTTQTVGNSVVFTGTVTGSPVATDQLGYGFWQEDHEGGNSLSEVIHSPSRTVTQREAATRQYRMRVFWNEGSTSRDVHSNWITIQWQ